MKTIPLKTALATALLSLAALPLAQAADVELDSIAAVVNEGVVLTSELSTEVEFLKLQARGNNQPLPSDDIFNERVLERLIDQEIQRQHANKLGVVVDASSVNQAIEQVAQGNNMSNQQFRETLLKQGFNYNHYRRSIEHEILMSRLVQRDVQSRYVGVRKNWPTTTLSCAAHFNCGRPFCPTI